MKTCWLLRTEEVFNDGEGFEDNEDCGVTGLLGKYGRDVFHKSYLQVVRVKKKEWEEDSFPMAVSELHRRAKNLVT